MSNKSNNKAVNNNDQATYTEEFETPVTSKAEEVAAQLLSQAKEMIDSGELPAEETEEEGRKELPLNFYALAGGLLGAGVGAVPNRSVSGLCAGATAATVTSYCMKDKEREPVKDAALGFLAGFGASATVNVAVAMLTGESEVEDDSDDVVQTITVIQAETVSE